MQLNKETFIKILQHNQGIIRKIANSYCKNVDDRDDLVQEISIHLWKAWSKYDDKFKISTWMYRISLNVAISFYRKTYKRTAFNQNIIDEIVFIDESEDSSLSENLKIMYHHISQLDELNKALIILLLDNCSYDEIASTLGVSKTNVATKISRIKTDLKEKFNQK